MIVAFLTSPLFIVIKRSVFSIILFYLSFSYTLADTTVYKNPPGPSTTDTVTFAWDVVNGTGQCSGDTNYPDYSDSPNGWRDGWRGLRSWWIESTHSSSGSSNAYLVLAPPSTNYYFICSENVSGTYIADIVYVNIRSCTDAYGPGYVWNGSTCQVSAPPSGNLSLSPASCEISAGNSTCTISGLTWSTANVSSPNVRDANTGSTLSTLSDNASPLLVYIAFGGTTFELRDGSTVLDTRVGSASCASGTIWNGSACYNPAPSVDISTGASGVDIGGSVGYSSNGSDQGNDLTAHNFDWAIPSGSWNWQNGNQGGSTDSSPQSSFGGTSASSRSITFTPNTPGVYTLHFSVLDNNGTRWTSSSDVTLTVCDSNHRWVAGWCQPIVKITSFSYSPTSPPDVDTPESARLSWTTENATSCTISGGQYSNTAIGPLSSGSVTTNGLASSPSSITYTLTCQGIEGPKTAQVIVPVASGSINSNVSSCVIPVNQPTCPATLSWSSVNMTNPRITSQTGVVVSASPSGSVSWGVGYGPQTYTFRNHSYVHGSVNVTGYCAGGTLWNGSVCESALKIGSLTYSPSTPADVDYGETAVLNWTGVANATSCTLNGGQFTNANVGTAASGSTTTIPLFANTTYTLTCQGFGEAVSRQVVVPVASGSIDATPLVCIIPTGQSSCTTDVTWTSFNMSSPRVTNASDVTLSISPTGDGVQFPAYYGNNTFALKNATVTHDSIVVNAACDPSAIWSGVMCVATNGAPSINSASCFIAAGASTCDLDVSWSVSNPLGPVTVTRPYAGDSVFASGNFGVEIATFPYGTYSLDLRDSGTILVSGTYTAECVNGSSWNGLVCAPLSSSVTGSINTASCVILAGNNSCELYVQWSTVNATPPVTITRPYAGDSQFATGASGNQPATFVGEGTWNLNLRSAGNILASGTYTTACEIGAVWNGSVCSLSLVTGNLVVSANECLIATGQNTCNVNATWTTAGASSPSLRNDTAGTVLSTLANRVTPFPVTVTYPSTLFSLREGGVGLDAETVIARCASGGWDTQTLRCANPSIASAVVTGQYYAAIGNIAVTCTNANKYSVIHSETGTVIANNLPYPGFTVNVPVTLSGNYTIYCIQGLLPSAPEVRYYNAGPPPSSAIVLSASPRTIPKSSNSSINWTIQHPKDDCILEAKTICSKGICTGDQSRETSALNNKILTEFTDAQSVGDLLTPRTILNSLRKIPTSRVDTDWKTTGIKTFNLKYSTQFELRCGSSTQTTRVLITTTGEK